VAEIDARRVAFRTRLFGFDKAEVRAFLSNLLSEYEQSRAQLESILACEVGKEPGLPALRPMVEPDERSLTQSIEGSQAEMNQELLPQPAHDLRLVKSDEASLVPIHEMSHLVERTLASAHRVADEVRTEAQQEAERLIRDAEERAERLLADARARSARLIDEAAAEGTGKQEAAQARLRETEREIEHMQACQRELRAALESMVTTLGEALADARARSVIEPAGRAAEEPITQADSHSAIRVLAS
jgi:DivIVA domain-containing protein